MSYVDSHWKDNNKIDWLIERVFVFNGISIHFDYFMPWYRGVAFIEDSYLHFYVIIY